MRCDLHHRARINLPGITKVIQNRKQHDRSRHQTAIVHLCRGRIHHLWENAENDHDDPIPDCKRIQQDPPDARDVEGAPDELVGVPGTVGHLGGRSDGAADAVVEEEGFSEDVGGVERAYAKGDDGVEGSGGADIDEADEARDKSHDEDGMEWDRGGRLDLQLSVSVCSIWVKD